MTGSHLVQVRYHTQDSRHSIVLSITACAKKKTGAQALKGLEQIYYLNVNRRSLIDGAAWGVSEQGQTAISTKRSFYSMFLKGMRGAIKTVLCIAIANVFLWYPVMFLPAN